MGLYANGFQVIICPTQQKFVKFTDLDFTAAPPLLLYNVVAKNTLLFIV